MVEYILIRWPESQFLMTNSRFNECLLVQNTKGHNEVGNCAYMVPKDLYNEIYENN